MTCYSCQLEMSDFGHFLCHCTINKANNIYYRSLCNLVSSLQQHTLPPSTRGRCIVTITLRFLTTYFDMLQWRKTITGINKKIIMIAELLSECMLTHWHTVYWVQNNRVIISGYCIFTPVLFLLWQVKTFSIETYFQLKCPAHPHRCAHLF